MHCDFWSPIITSRNYREMVLRRDIQTCKGEMLSWFMLGWLLQNRMFTGFVFLAKVVED